MFEIKKKHSGKQRKAQDKKFNVAQLPSRVRITQPMICHMNRLKNKSLDFLHFKESKGGETFYKILYNEYRI